METSSLSSLASNSWFINLSHAEMSKVTPRAQAVATTYSVEDSVAVHAAGAAKRSANTESGRGSWGSENGFGPPCRKVTETAWA